MRVVGDRQINFLIQSDSRTQVINVDNVRISHVIIGTVVGKMFVVVIDSGVDDVHCQTVVVIVGTRTVRTIRGHTLGCHHTVNGTVFNRQAVIIAVS